MWRSARSTERGRRASGFTLLEVMIAAGIFSVVLVIALSQIGESSSAAKLSMAQADLRRIGTSALEAIVKEMRGTQSRYTTIDDRAIPRARIQYKRIDPNDPFNPVSGEPKVEQSGGLDVIYEFRETQSSSLGSRFGQISKHRGTALSGGLVTNPALEVLTQETAVSGDVPFTGATPITAGLMVSSTSGAPLSPLSVTNVFTDIPVKLDLKLVMKRSIGRRTASTDWFVFVVCQTQIELRPSRSYR